MIPAHSIYWNHFYSFLSVQTRVHETRRSGPPESRRTLSRRNHFSSSLSGETGTQGKPGDQARRDALHFFSREPVFLIPSASDRSPGSQEIGLAGMHSTFFQGNHFSSFLQAGTAALEARRSGSPGCTALFFKGTTFPHSLCFTDAVGRNRTFCSSSSSSSSPQRDSGILAVRKTGASVLRLLPPTS